MDYVGNIYNFSEHVAHVVLKTFFVQETTKYLRVVIPVKIKYLLICRHLYLTIIKSIHIDEYIYTYSDKFNRTPPLLY
jgi:hypothetical protein